MKLLTLNTHSWLETQQLAKIDALATKIASENYDVIALQEVNQRCRPARPLELAEDNHGLLLVQSLREKGLHYQYRWAATHQAYGKFDEGVALLSLHPIEATEELLLSPATLPYEHYQRRKALGIQVRINQQAYWFYSLHFSWWQSEQRGFQSEWTVFNQQVQRQTAPVFLMGDFNNPAHLPKQGYDLIGSDGWYDAFVLADETRGEATVDKKIAGWEENQQAIRIDYIFCSTPQPVVSAHVCFDGSNGPVISDHFGFAITLPESLA